MKTYKTYKAAERNAEERGLQLAEYGTLSSGKGYCYWNASGNRNDRAIIYCEYNWTRGGRAGKVLHAYPCGTWAEAQKLAKEWNAEK